MQVEQIKSFMPPDCARDCVRTCAFERYARLAANQVPEVNQGHVIHLNGRETTEETIAVFDLIRKGRESARNAGCPNINNVNPQFPGTEAL